MILKHVTLCTSNLEELRTYYTTFFGREANEKEVNPIKKFGSYFITFCSGEWLDLMRKVGIPANLNKVTA